MEGLHGPTKYNSLAESGAVLDPHIICKDLGDCPTGDAVQPRSGRGGRRFKSCHSDQLSRKSAGFRHSFVYVARLSAKIRRLAEICGLALVLNS